MVKCCCVPGCTSTLKTTGISFHRCPKEESRKKLWTFTLRRDGKRRPNRPVSCTMYVCSLHFTPSDYREVINGSNKCLKKEAFPTIFELNSSGPGTSVTHDFQAQSSSITNTESSSAVKEETVELRDHVSPLETPELDCNATHHVKVEPTDSWSTVDPLAMSPQSSEPDPCGVKTEHVGSSQAALGADSLPAFERAVNVYDSNAVVRKTEARAVARVDSDVTHPVSGNNDADVTTQSVLNSSALPVVTNDSGIVPTLGQASPAYFYVFNGVDYRLQLLQAQYLKCSDCDEYFTTDSLLQDHRTTKHVKESAFFCDACKLSFASHSLLEEHSRVCEPLTDVDRSDTKSRSKWKHWCGVCGACFDSARALDVHGRSHALDSKQNGAATDGRLAQGREASDALSCGGQAGLEAVVLTCEPDLDISDTGRGQEMSESDYILPHSINESAPDACDTTIVVTTDPNPTYSIPSELPTSADGPNLTYNICGVNADFCRIVDNQYQCVKCHQKFASDTKFKAHNCHGIKKSFICGVCKNSYPNENSLIGHSWSHSVFYCGICRKMYASLKEKLDHMKLFHPCDHDHATCLTTAACLATAACSGSIGT